MTSSSLISEKLEKELIDEKNKVYRRQGLIGKGLDKTKALINVGRNHKSVQHKIDEFKKGNIDYETVDKYIKDYKYGQRDASELVLDTLTGLSAFGMYSATRKISTFISPFAGKDVSTKLGKYSKGAGIGLALLTGLLTKPTLRFIDRIYLKRKEKKGNIEEIEKFYQYVN